MAVSFEYATWPMHFDYFFQNYKNKLWVNPCFFSETKSNHKLRFIRNFSRIRWKRNLNFLEQLSGNNLENGADGTFLAGRMHSFLTRCRQLVLHRIVVLFLN